MADEGALAAAKRLGLPTGAEELLTQVARGQRNEELVDLLGALARRGAGRVRRGQPASELVRRSTGLVNALDQEEG